MARPTKYKPEYEKQVYKLCLLKATDKQIADYFETSETTINNWKKIHLGFFESLKAGKERADATVADSLYQRACGYTHSEEKIFCNNGVIVRAKTTKHYPPDTAAAIIWLKNRAGWTDKTQTEHSLDKPTATLLGLIDGDSKGKLPTKGEEDG